MPVSNKQVRWLNINGAANVLGITVEKVNLLIERRGCATHFDGTGKEVAFYLDDHDGVPAYSLVPFDKRKDLPSRD